MKRKWISVLVIIICTVIIVIAAVMLTRDNAGELNVMSMRKETINIWYTDDALTDYLHSKAVEFYDATDIRVEIKLASGLEYLEEINQASLDEEQTTPDIYIVSNDSLEKAYLSGLATEVSDTQLLEDSARFSDTARRAVTYNGKYVGYPLYYETAALLYNKTYLDQIASEAELADSNTLIPSSIADILTFADQYSTPENVEYFFRWDVSDIFYNYFFIGNYITVGGQAGDDRSQIDIYNTDAIASLKVYQEMNQFFSIEPEETSYASIIQEFLEGRTIYTVATSDCLATLEQAKKDGTISYEYGITYLPDINQELQTKGMSVTNAMVINGYSTHKQAANSFITYVLNEDTDCEIYTYAGKLPVQVQDSYVNDNMIAFQNNYDMSVPIPKLMATSNFWIELETCFAKVWSGADANAEIKELSEQIKTQLTGTAFQEVLLEDPQVELLPAIEYEE